jgi:hypothetical protein
MIDKAIKGIIGDGLDSLERLRGHAESVAKDAEQVLLRARADIAALVKMSEDVNVKTLERFQGLLTVEFPVHKRDNGANPYLVLQVDSGGYHQLKGVLGPQQLESGQYRALVLIERVGPLEHGR